MGEILNAQKHNTKSKTRTPRYNGVCSSPTSRDKRANVREWWWALRMVEILNARKHNTKCKARTPRYNGVCSPPTSRDKRANVRVWWWALPMEDIPTRKNAPTMEDILNAQKTTTYNARHEHHATMGYVRPPQEETNAQTFGNNGGHSEWERSSTRKMPPQWWTSSTCKMPPTMVDILNARKHNTKCKVRTLRYNGICSPPTRRDKRANVREWWWALRMGEIHNARKHNTK